MKIVKKILDTSYKHFYQKSNFKYIKIHFLHVRGAKVAKNKQQFFWDWVFENVAIMKHETIDAIWMYFV